jgi:serine/threonine protein kinase
VDCTAVADVSVFSRNVRDLAVRLKKIEPTTFHLLQCLGVSRTRDQVTRRTTSLHFVFKMHKSLHSPKSLRQLLLSSGSPSLTSRLSLARDLATSVSYIHVLDFVHKNIRPETALVFEGSDNGSPFGPLSLLGFKTFRGADGKSLRLANTNCIENMYQHPERQGSVPGTDHRMQHGIYSLGVCLLEIGLWTSFVTASATNPSPNIPADSSTPHKTYFTTMAREHLPLRMGEKYTKVVINCLTCMDATNDDFGDENEFEDDFGIRIGVKYIERVRTRSACSELR